jgi:hypothetical protein
MLKPFTCLEMECTICPYWGLKDCLKNSKGVILYDDKKNGYLSHTK